MESNIDTPSDQVKLLIDKFSNLDIDDKKEILKTLIISMINEGQLFEDLDESIENYEVGVMDIQLAVNDLYFGIVNYLPKKEAFSWCNYYVHGSWKSRKY